MAAARARRADPAPAPANAPRPAVRAVKRPSRATATAVPAGSGIRWDRVGRMVLLLVLVGIVSLYIGPLHSYWSTRHESQAKRNDVQRLQRENVRLRERRAALRSKGTLEKEARRLGMVRPGERPYSVSGLPKGP
ncbi:MAG: septum formation initiator family protein [Solirubrobacterales bacterium]|nr:septum formation initiator family protein [Solirubrobacterales bacterium]